MTLMNLRVQERRGKIKNQFLERKHLSTPTLNSINKNNINLEVGEGVHYIVLTNYSSY